MPKVYFTLIFIKNRWDLGYAWKIHPISNHSVCATWCQVYCWSSSFLLGITHIFFNLHIEVKCFNEILPRALKFMKSSPTLNIASILLISWLFRTVLSFEPSCPWISHQPLQITWFDSSKHGLSSTRIF